MKDGIKEFVDKIMAKFNEREKKRLHVVAKSYSEFLLEKTQQSYDIDDEEHFSALLVGAKVFFLALLAAGIEIHNIQDRDNIKEELKEICLHGLDICFDKLKENGHAGLQDIETKTDGDTAS